MKVVSVEPSVNNGHPRIRVKTSTPSENVSSSGLRGRLCWRFAAVEKDGQVMFAILRFSTDGKSLLETYVKPKEVADPFLRALETTGVYRNVTEYSFSPSTVGTGVVIAVPEIFEEEVQISPRDLQQLRRIREALTA